MHSERLSEVKTYFDHGDLHIGYRRLLDASIETGDFSIYEDTLAFCDWFDNYNADGISKDPAQLHQQVNSLLEKMDKVSISPVDRNIPGLVAKDLAKTYHKGNFSLKGINFDLFPSQIIGLVGENGNGKTTLLRLLYGELKPDMGSIQYQLRSIPARHNFYDVKTRLAFIPQRPVKWYGSLMDNLQFTSTHYGFRGKENYVWTEMLCARMGLRAFRTFTWNRISSGYKMRFELARTLLKKPEVLLLDEPLANLDVLAQQVILEDLRFLARSQRMPLGIILSSQQLYEVEKVSEQVIFLKDGKPKYQSLRPAAATPGQVAAPLVVELETSTDRESLMKLFSNRHLQQISFNGGVYILYFSGPATVADVLRTLGESNTPVKYFRDISTSSRRFFDA